MKGQGDDGLWGNWQEQSRCPTDAFLMHLCTGLFGCEHRVHTAWLLYKNLKGGFSVVGFSLFCQVTCSRKRENGLKSHQGEFSLGSRKNFVAKRVIKHWSRLSRKVVNASSLEVFKAWLNGVLRYLI